VNRAVSARPCSRVIVASVLHHAFAGLRMADRGEDILILAMESTMIRILAWNHDEDAPHAIDAEALALIGFVLFFLAAEPLCPSV